MLSNSVHQFNKVFASNKSSSGLRSDIEVDRNSWRLENGLIGYLN